MDLAENCQVFATAQLADGLTNCGNTLARSVGGSLYASTPSSHLLMPLISHKEVRNLPNLFPYRIYYIPSS